MDFIQELIKKSGFYVGQGVNHEGDHFVGKLEITPILNNKSFQIKFNASSTSGFTFHDEVSLLAKNENDEWCLFNLNSNSEKCLIHKLESSDFLNEKLTLSFMYGDFIKEDTFRERVCLDLFEDDKVGYHYYWGVPGGAFQYRSGLMMQNLKSV